MSFLNLCQCNGEVIWDMKICLKEFISVSAKRNSKLWGENVILNHIAN